MVYALIPLKLPPFVKFILMFTKFREADYHFLLPSGKTPAPLPTPRYNYFELAFVFVNEECGKVH